MISNLDLAIRFVKHTYGGKGVFFYLLSLLALPLDGTAVWGSLIVTSFVLYTIHWVYGTRAPSSWAPGDAVVMVVKHMSEEERKSALRFTIDEISEDRKTITYSHASNGRKFVSTSSAEHVLLTFDHYSKEQIDA